MKCYAVNVEIKGSGGDLIEMNKRVTGLRVILWHTNRFMVVRNGLFCCVRDIFQVWLGQIRSFWHNCGFVLHVRCCLFLDVAM